MHPVAIQTSQPADYKDNYFSGNVYIFAPAASNYLQLTAAAWTWNLFLALNKKPY